MVAVETVLKHASVAPVDHATSTVSPSYAGKMPWRKLRLQLGVPGLVGQMGEIGAAGAERLRGLDRLGDAQVRRMGPPPERVEHQHVEAPQAAHARLGDRLHVGDVGQAAEPIAEDPQVTVLEGERQDLDARHVDRAARLRRHAVSRLGFEVPS